MQMRIAELLILLSAAILGKSNRGKIVNGYDGDINDYPYQVSLLYRNFHICGGSILSSTVVLTAAHCTNRNVHVAFSVHAGDTRKTGKNGQWIKVAQVIQHKKFDPKTFNNDMSILILAASLVFKQGVQPIPLAQHEPPVNAYATVSGWGRLIEGGPLPDILQVLKVPILDKKQCNILYSNLTPNMLCAGFIYGIYDACMGDSGGPLTYNEQLVGVVSFGAGCAKPGKPGVYASVPEMIKWIQSNANL